ncbi:MAG: NPCBM/NEW2 domain-containing protein [Pirellulales bacterium]
MTAWLAMMACLAAADVELTPLGAPPVKGTVTQWSAERVVVATAAGEQTFESPRIHSLKFSGAPSAKPASPTDVTLLLLDGSELHAATFQAKGGKATGKLAGDRDYECRTRSIRAVRFRPPNDDLNAAWQTQLDEKATGDLLVIRKTAKGGSQVTLDRQSGIVHEVTAETIQFELDGDRIPVKRERIEGVVYFQPTERELPDPVCRIEDRSGGVWNVKSIRWEADKLQLETVAGAVATLGVEQLVRADFSVGNTVYLSDVDPESLEWTPFVASLSPTLAKFRQFGRDASASGGPLTSGGEKFDKGIVARSRTTAVYRVPKNFRRFEARLGVQDGAAKDLADLRVSIVGDGKSLFEATITGKDAPQDIALDLSGVRRLAILVDFGANEGTGDWLVFGNARMTK